MRLTTLTATAALLLLAGCGRSGDDVSLTNASVDQVAATQQNTKVQPGEWEVTAELVKQETTGAPAGMPTPPRMPPTTTKICITPEQVNKPGAMFGKGLDQFKKSCIYDTFEMSNGKMDAQMHCDLKGGAKVKATTSGTFSPTEFTTQGKSEVTMPGGMTMSTTTKISAHRLGECQPGDRPAGMPKK